MTGLMHHMLISPTGFGPGRTSHRCAPPCEFQRLSKPMAGETTTPQTKETPMKRHLLALVLTVAALVTIPTNLSAQWTDSQYLGRLSANPYDPNSISNPYGQYGSPYSPTSINNPYSRYGSPYSPQSATNPYATSAPRLYGNDGAYLGRLSSNPYDPDSVSNPYGRYGNPYSPTSINNPYGKYGNPYGPLSTPTIIGGDDADN